MRHLLLALVLAALGACAAGTDPTVQCPADQSQTLTRAQWEACYGYQDHDSK